MRVAVLGNGLMGRTIADEFQRRFVGTESVVNVFLYGHDAFDITDYDSIVRIFRDSQPDAAINTVAYHRLAECESNPNLAWNVNAKGAGRVASLVPTVYISTDYVFNDDGPHDESMPGERPASEYGRSKLAGELETLEHDGIVVRIAAVFGHHSSHKGPTFPETVLSGFDPLRLPSDQVFTPTYAPDAAERIVDLALQLGHICGPTVPCVPCLPQGIYHATNKGSTTWADFAQHIVEVTRHKRHILPVKAHDSLRPRDSRLVSKRLPALPHWADALNRWALKKEFIPLVSPLRK